MGCACGGGSAQKQINFEVKFKDGSTQTFSTSQEAQIAIRTARGGTMKAVPAR